MVSHKHTLKIGLIKCNKYFFNGVKFLYSINVTFMYQIVIFDFNFMFNMQQADLMGLLRTILIFLIVYYSFRFLGKNICSYIIKKSSWKYARKSSTKT